jgi:alanine dehydrogenase
MPGAVPITSTHALTNATLPYAMALAERGVVEAIRSDPGLRLGVNVAGGQVTHPAVAESVGMSCVPVEQALAGAGGAGRAKSVSSGRADRVSSG